METNKKQYGLIIPKKDSAITPNTVIKKPSIFDESDSEEETNNVDWVKKALQKETYGGGALSRQSKADIQRVMQEDPTAYQYDEIYDEMAKQKNEAVAAKKTDRKPKYVQLLIMQAERRKKEDERRKERQIQKEREAEGDQFIDKESFVTSAYKKKLEEMKKLDEEEKRQDMLEGIGDVTKQQDLSGFYRHLYENIVDRNTVVIKDEIKSEDESTSINDKPTTVSKPKAQRQYRKRVTESDSVSENEENSPDIDKCKTSTCLSISDKKSTGERNRESDLPKDKNKAKKTHIKNPSSKRIKEKSSLQNMDADSESSNSDDRNSKSSSNEGEDVKKRIDTDGKMNTKVEKLVVKDEKRRKNDEDQEDKENVTEKEKKPKRSIWEKRTVGEVYDAALQRYYERKGNRLAIPAS